MIKQPTIILSLKRPRVIVRTPGPQGPPGPPGSGGGGADIAAGDGIAVAGSSTKTVAVDSTVARRSDAAMTNARTPVAHGHSAADINDGTLPIARGGTGASALAGAAGGASALVSSNGLALASNANHVVSASRLTSPELAATTTLRLGTSTVLSFIPPASGSAEYRLPADGAAVGQVLSVTEVDGEKIRFGFAASAAAVSLTMPAGFAVSGSPGASLVVAWSSQSANRFLAGPSVGGSAAPTFRTLALADLPAADVAGQSLVWSGLVWETRAIDHGGLVGTADDDHAQYIHVLPQATNRNLIQPNAAVPGLRIVEMPGGVEATSPQDNVTLFGVEDVAGNNLLRAYYDVADQAYVVSVDAFDLRVNGFSVVLENDSILTNTTLVSIAGASGTGAFVRQANGTVVLQAIPAGGSSSSSLIGVDLTQTGLAGGVLQQASRGGNVTVARLAASDLPIHSHHLGDIAGISGFARTALAALTPADARAALQVQVAGDYAPARHSHGREDLAGLRTGTAVLASGTVTIPVAGVTATSHVVASRRQSGGTMGPGLIVVPAANQISITATDASGATVATDTSSVVWIAFL